ncbi:MAG TPA: glycoside hydrolase family 16 protein [Acidimicrobiales bacterium]
MVDNSEPSGMAPPTANAMTGYSLAYSNDFTGSTLSSGWDAYSGKPSGDAGAQWGTAHVVEGGGIMSLNAWQDPAYNNEWVTGGVSQSTTRTYGAYYVRSRVTAAGPTNVELLFPATGWPPEIDFNETSGVSTATSATTIWAASGSSKSQVQFNVKIDMTQWHTWGVVWTPTSVTYTVDGQVWGTVNNASEVPQQPMRLDLQQQTWCSSNFACPTAPASMQVDWVAEYGAN